MLEKPGEGGKAPSKYVLIERMLECGGLPCLDVVIPLDYLLDGLSN